MRIACLAWGSLIWKPGELELASDWMPDGPWLPIEFSREADEGELATALTPEAPLIQVTWARLASSELAVACDQLRRREGIGVDRSDGVGSIAKGDDRGRGDDGIRDWLATRDLDAVIWTALPPRFGGIEGRAPSVDEAVDFLGGLRGDKRAHAEQYVRRVPTALRTAHRAAFERRLGWIPRPA